MYKVRFTDKCSKSFKKLDKKLQTKILEYLYQRSLLENPAIFGKALAKEKKGYWRYRVGDYRIISIINDKEFIILAVDVDHRSKVYKEK